MKQLELFDLTHFANSSDVPNNNLPDREHENKEQLFDNPTKNDPPTPPGDDQELFDNPNNITELAVSEYKPGGTAAKTNKYYRFSYKRNGRVKHIHIKGGNTTNKVAIERKEQVERWIVQQIPPDEIVKRIKQW